jgi:hypothetical protein
MSCDSTKSRIPKLTIQFWNMVKTIETIGIIPLCAIDLNLCFDIPCHISKHCTKHLSCICQCMAHNVLTQCQTPMIFSRSIDKNQNYFNRCNSYKCGKMQYFRYLFMWLIMYFSQWNDSGIIFLGVVVNFNLTQVHPTASEYTYVSGNNSGCMYSISCWADFLEKP